MFKCQNSHILNKLSKSDCTRLIQILLLPKSSGDQNAPQSKASSFQYIPQHQKTTFMLVHIFMEAIVFTQTSWPIISNNKYLIITEALKQAIQAQNHQWALAGDFVGTL